MPPVRRVAAVVDELVDHGGHVYTVYLKPKGRLPQFCSGQFLHLTLDSYDPTGFWPESRVFSIACSPQSCERICLCYSVVGKYTTRMERELVLGKEVWLKLPYGEFIIKVEQPTVLIAGGTGITAFAGFLEELSAPRHSVTLLYGARRPDQWLFRGTIDRAVQAHSNVQGVLAAQCGPLPPADPAGRMEYHEGLLSLDMVWQILTDPIGSRYYLAGPPGMLEAFLAALDARGVPRKCILFDAWV